jgi:membrane protein DedA with SNARE-associated domain
MRLLPFTIYTLLGSYIWCLALASIGMKMGQNWKAIGPWFHRFDTLIAIALVAGAAYILYHRLRSILAAPRTVS